MPRNNCRRVLVSAPENPNRGFKRPKGVCGTKRLLRAFMYSSKAVDKVVDLPSLFSVLPNVVWFLIIRRVLFQNDFFYQFNLFFTICYCIFIIFLICLTEANCLLIRSITVCILKHSLCFEPRRQ